MKKVFVPMVCCALLASCATRNHKLTLVSASPDEVIEQLNSSITIDYNENIDRVTISSNDPEKPISLMGTRLNGEKVTQSSASALCSLLGFTFPEKANFGGDKYPVKIKVSTEKLSGNSTVTTSGMGKNINYPALHIDAKESPFSSLMFTHIPEIGAHDLLNPTIEDHRIAFGEDPQYSYYSDYNENILKKKYLDTISCEGTTYIHFDDEGKFNKDNFLLKLKHL